MSNFFTHDWNQKIILSFLNQIVTGDSIAVGTNFLALGHIPMIREMMILDHSRTYADDKFPDLPELLALLLLTATEKIQRACPFKFRLFDAVKTIVTEKAVQEAFTI